MNIETASVSKLLFYIGEYQQIQKTNPPSSIEWQRASEALEPLFAEMAKRR